MRNDVRHEGTTTFITTGDIGTYQSRIIVQEEKSKSCRVFYEDDREHGHWEQVHGYATPGGDPLVRCPYCKSRDSWHLRGIETHVGWNYCPVCGVNMDAKEEEHAEEA